MPLYLPNEKTLKNVDELVPQERLNRLYERLWERGEQYLAIEATFVAYVQPPTDHQANYMAYFRVITPHPKERFEGQTLETIGSMPLSHWREAEDDYWRYADVPDPLLAIFAGLMKQHMETYNNLRELND